MRTNVNRIGIFYFMYLGFCCLFSKIFIDKRVKIMRLPFFIIGKENISFGKNFSSGSMLRIEILSDSKKEKLLVIGDNCILNNNVHIAVAEKIFIEDNVLIGSNVLISDHNHGVYSGEYQDSPTSIPNERKLIHSSISIGENTWIGDNVVILPGVKIGKGVVIGAATIVNKSIPENCMVVGNPMKIIKKYDFIERRWRKFEEKNRN